MRFERWRAGRLFGYNLRGQLAAGLRGPGRCLKRGSFRLASGLL
jgi:hypothetical protein